ncbi:hypothetical protein TSOC_003008 [Tetrabaena socialis]|uniref:Uncharacterized protein n=1 Tax=Tetrabaena socialis TaxID=47790 RepID=A0A2J8ACP4_9CHLO|nr:hypothetical protein TSOC_003008 [Tetrabaena socialis]|eukprot:PNH10291.1 hypothetical protein TSOC_003008 [Tetrabaena socialis]
MRHGTLILGLEDVDKLEDDDDDDEDDDDNRPTTAIDAAGRLMVGYEEKVQCLTRSGPVELMVLRAPEERAKAAAKQEGLQGGLAAGCKAALLVEVKPTAGFSNLWQALAAGIALARSNAVGGRSSYPGSPVHVVLTDTMNWYFLGIKAVAAAVDEGAGGETAACSGSRTAADGSATCTSGLEFKINTGEIFRLFDCSMIVASLLRPSTPVEGVLQVMYRLYKALYPDESIDDLPAAIREGERLAKKAAHDWMAPHMESLQRQREAEAEATAKSAAAAEKAAAVAAEKAAAEKEAAVAAEKAAAEKAVKLVQQAAAVAAEKAAAEKEAAVAAEKAAAEKAVKLVQQAAAVAAEKAAAEKEAAVAAEKAAAEKAVKLVQQAAAVAAEQAAAEKEAAVAAEKAAAEKEAAVAAEKAAAVAAARLEAAVKRALQEAAAEAAARHKA